MFDHKGYKPKHCAQHQVRDNKHVQSTTLPAVAHQFLALLVGTNLALLDLPEALNLGSQQICT